MSEKSNPIVMLVILYGAAFIAAFSENIINVALVDIMSEFSIDSITAQWLVTGYMIVASIIVASMSFLSRRFPLRTLFFAGGGIFLFGAIADMLAPSFPLLLVFRLVQAIGTGIFIPTMMGTVLAVAPQRRLGTFMSIGSCCITLGPAFGPVIAGVMVTLFGWRGIFLPPIVVMAILVIAGVFLLKNLGPGEQAHFDPLSLCLSSVGVTAIVFGLTQLTTNLLLALVALIVGVLLIFAFARRQLRLDEPMMNIRPAFNMRFSSGTILAVICMMETFSMSVLMPLYFQGSLGYAALISGLLVLIPIILNALGALLGGRIMDRSGEWPLLPVGFVFIVIGQIVVAITATGMNVVPVIIGAVLVYTGVGLAMSPSQTSALASLTREENPHGVSMMNTFVQMSGALGPSLFVGILSSGSAAALASGASSELAQASGFSNAVVVAAVIGAVGLAIAIWYARTAHKTAHPKAAVEVEVKSE